MKFETFAKIWFEQYAIPNLKARTVSSLRQMEGRVYRALGHIRLDKITAPVIQRFAAELGREGANLRTGGPLAPKTIRNYLSFISGILCYAAEQGLIAENPCRAVKAPPIPYSERPCYTPAEAQSFLDALQAEPLCWRVYFTLAIFGGFRRGELLGLEWRDICLDTGVVTIRRTSLYTREKGVFTDTPKTAKSLRSLKMPRPVTELLRQYRAWQAARRLCSGGPRRECDRLFTSAEGLPLNPACVENWLARFFARTGLRRVNLHSFRHLNATLLINGGADIKTVSAALGHSRTGTTLNIYAHTVAEAQAEASAAIADILTLRVSG